MTDEPAVRGGIEGYPTGLSWDQHHQVALVVASASTDAADCARLLAALGIHPADGLETRPAPSAGAAEAKSGIRRRRSTPRWTRD